MASTSQDFTSGQVLTAAEMDQLPQGILSTGTITTNLGPTSSTTEADLLSATATIAQTNRRLRVRFHCRAVTPSASGDTYVFRIKEGSTTLQEAHVVTTAASGTFPGLDFEAIVDSPTAASHTYKATVQRAIGSGTLTISGTSTAPIIIYVEDAGQA